MEDLIKRLQAEAGLSEDQSVKAVSIIKDQMEKGDFDVDWDKFAKGKYDVLLDKAKDKYQDVAEGAHKYTDKLAEKVDSLKDSARQNLKDLSQKAVDFFDDDDDDKKK